MPAEDDRAVTPRNSGLGYHGLMHRTLSAEQTRLDWVSSTPFVLIHLAPLGLFWTGVSAREWMVCIALYFVRMFFITAVYHRYFSHRSYKMSRAFQFLMAVGGTTATQKGPLWWASHHRMHHKFSDLPGDIHSPKDGRLWSHMGWILCHAHDDTEWRWMKDFAKFPELVWLNKYHLIPPLLLATSLAWWGGLSMLLCGYFLSTAILYHGTFSINSLMHIWGERRYATTDTSRNNWILALITLGEGWHNNHHYYQSSTNQGFFWWEIDISYYVLKMLSWVGLTSCLRRPSLQVLAANRVVEQGDVALAAKPGQGTAPLSE